MQQLPLLGCHAVFKENTVNKSTLKFRNIAKTFCQTFYKNQMYRAI